MRLKFQMNKLMEREFVLNQRHEQLSVVYLKVVRTAIALHGIDTVVYC